MDKEKDKSKHKDKSKCKTRRTNQTQVKDKARTNDTPKTRTRTRTIIKDETRIRIVQGKEKDRKGKKGEIARQGQNKGRQGYKTRDIYTRRYKTNGTCQDNG